MTLSQQVAEANGAAVYHAPWQDLLSVVPRCDAVMVDAPYSARVHTGHFAGTQDTDEAGQEWLARKGYDDKRTLRRPLPYAAWTAEDVTAFVSAWAAVCGGWMVSITDHILAPAWESAMRAAGRYVFAPLPFLELGKQPRLTGDGPASWTCWIVVSRPKTRAFAGWGSLPGGYSTANKDQNRIPGGKPLWLMHRLVEDYSKPGDLIVDPCCGAGTTLVAAIRIGRRAIGGDIAEERTALAAQWIKNPHAAPPGAGERPTPGQPSLFGSTP